MENRSIEKTVNYEKYIPERYINSTPNELRTLVKKALEKGSRDHVKFVKDILDLLRSHGRKKALVSEISAMYIEFLESKENSENSETSPVDASPKRNLISKDGSVTPGDNKDYLMSLEEHDIISYAMNRHNIIVAPNAAIEDEKRRKEVMVDNFLAMLKLNKASKAF